jgi:hypothetical protein
MLYEVKKKNEYSLSLSNTVFAGPVVQVQHLQVYNLWTVELFTNELFTNDQKNNEDSQTENWAGVLWWEHSYILVPITSPAFDETAHVHYYCVPITYYYTVPRIFDHWYLVGKSTSSKIADTNVSGF